MKGRNDGGGKISATIVEVSGEESAKDLIRKIMIEDSIGETDGPC